MAKPPTIPPGGTLREIGAPRTDATPVGAVGIPAIGTPAGQHGSIVATIPMLRSMKVYPIFEAELDALATFDYVTKGAIAVAGAGASLFVTLVTENKLSVATATESQMLLTVGSWVVFALTAIAGVVALLSWRKEGAAIDKIKRDSTTRIDIEGRAHTAQP